jgi:hypothetical protein
METFRGPNLKLARAKQHIDDLDAEIARFLARKPYRIMVEPNASGEHPEWPHDRVMRISEQPPESFSLIIGDAIHNMRSSLDLLVCAFVRVEGKSDKRVQFPIARDANSLEEAIKQANVHRASPKAVDFIRALKPYEGPGGNTALCDIHKLDILDKHRLIITVSNVAHFEDVTIGVRGNSLMATMPTFGWGALEDGAVLFHAAETVDVKIGDEIPATYQIAFGPGQPLHHEPVVKTLKILADYIESVLKCVVPI